MCLNKAFLSDSCHALVGSLERDFYLFVRLAGHIFAKLEFHVLTVEYPLKVDVNFDF